MDATHEHTYTNRSTGNYSISLYGHVSSPSIYLQGIRWILLICGNIKNLCFPTCSATLTSMGLSHVSLLFSLFKKGMKAIQKNTTTHVLSLIWTTRQNQITLRSAQCTNTKDGCLSYLFVSMWICSNFAVMPAKKDDGSGAFFKNETWRSSPGRSLASLLRHPWAQMWDCAKDKATRLLHVADYDSWQKMKKYKEGIAVKKS